MDHDFSIREALTFYQTYREVEPFDLELQRFDWLRDMTVKDVWDLIPWL